MATNDLLGWSSKYDAHITALLCTIPFFESARRRPPDEYTISFAVEPIQAYISDNLTTWKIIVVHMYLQGKKFRI
jgi:hypothetical protein